MQSLFGELNNLTPKHSHIGYYTKRWLDVKPHWESNFINKKKKKLKIAATIMEMEAKKTADSLWYEYKQSNINLNTKT